MSRNLIIIPGLGDYSFFYSFLKPIWRMLGFKTYIFSYDWEHATSNDSVMDALLEFIDQHTEQTFHIIGASAGGTAAVNALAERPSRIESVVTICTPYNPLSHLRNMTLKQSIERLQKNLKGADDQVKKRIASLHAHRDAVVTPSLSHYPSVTTQELPLSGHVLTIFVTLTILSFMVKKELLRNR